MTDQLATEVTLDAEALRASWKVFAERFCGPAIRATTMPERSGTGSSIAGRR